MYHHTNHPSRISDPLCLATNVLFAPDEKNQVPFFKGVFHFVNLHLYTTLLGATSEMDRTQTTEKIHLQATVLDPDNPSLCSLAFLLFQAVFGAHYDIVVDCYLDFRVLWQGSVITRVFFAAITCPFGFI